MDAVEGQTLCYCTPLPRLQPHICKNFPGWRVTTLSPPWSPIMSRGIWQFWCELCFHHGETISCQMLQCFILWKSRRERTRSFREQKVPFPVSNLHHCRIFSFRGLFCLKHHMKQISGHGAGRSTSRLRRGRISAGQEAGRKRVYSTRFPFPAAKRPFLCSRGLGSSWHVAAVSCAISSSGLAFCKAEGVSGLFLRVGFFLTALF